VSNKYFLIKIFGIVTLVVIIILYFLLYFIPSVKTISVYKRQIKDMNLKMTDYVKVENAFSFSNEREKTYFRQVGKELKSRIPEVKNKQEFIRVFTEISNYIQKLAEKDGIFNMLVHSDSRDLKVNAGSLSSDKKTLEELLSFAYRRLSQFQNETREKQQQIRQPETGGISTLVPGIESQDITLSFTGELRSAMNFINHIPWGSYYLVEDKIMVSAGEMFPYYIVFLKIYYIEKNTGDNSNSSNSSNSSNNTGANR
jgi:hypothetical protein